MNAVLTLRPRAHFCVIVALPLCLLSACTSGSPSPSGLRMRFQPERSLEQPVASWWLDGSTPDGNAASPGGDSTDTAGETTRCLPDSDRTDGAWTCAFSRAPTAQAGQLRLLLGDASSSCQDFDADCPWPEEYTNPDPLDGQGGSTVLEPLPDEARLPPSTLRLVWESGLGVTGKVVVIEPISGVALTGTAQYEAYYHWGFLTAPDECSLFGDKLDCSLPSGRPLIVRVLSDQVSIPIEIGPLVIDGSRPLSLPCPDQDGDRWPDAACAMPGEGDCDDANPAAYPGAAEVCGDPDLDCDGQVLPVQTWYRDDDGDGHGSSQSVEACDTPPGYVAVDDDCDDADPDTYPGAAEVCRDHRVNDCTATATTVCRYDGAIPLDRTRFLELRVSSAAYRTGTAVAVGDVTGDHIADLLIGAPGAPGNDTGRVYLYPGPAAPDRTLYQPVELETAAARIDGHEVGDQVGSALAVDDLSGDGVGDLAIGAPGVAQGAGAAYLLPGPWASSVYLLGNADIKVLGGHLGNGFGSALEPVDLDRDGRVDRLSVTAPAYSSSTVAESGAVYLIDPATLVPGMNYTTGVPQLDGLIEAADLGRALAFGDFDGDGSSDLAVGAPTATEEGSATLDTGDVYLAYQPADGYDGGEHDLSGAAKFLGLPDNGQAGYALLAGDLNGDGIDDLIIGAPASTSSTTAGRVYVVYGSKTRAAGDVPLAYADLSLKGEARAYTGYALAGCDLDRDGHFDLMVGEPVHCNEQGSEIGAVYVLYGPIDLSGEVPLGDAADAVLLGTFPGANTGAALSCGGDADGDGYPDLLIGAPDASSIATQAGEAWLVNGFGW